MKIEVLGAYGGESPRCRVTSLLIEERIALDAGSITQALPIDRQAQVRSIVLTHSHMDHTASLPFFVENVYGRLDGPIDIYGSRATIYSVRKHLFNNDTWPDFSRLPNHLLPAIRFHELEAEVPRMIDGVTFVPIVVDHLVPTFGYLIEKQGRSLLWSSDTGPTVRLWEIANRVANLRAICIDTSFETAMQNVADLSLHLTPATLERELRKLERRVPILVHHIKPPSIEAVRREVEALGYPDLGFLEQGETYEF